MGMPARWWRTTVDRWLDARAARAARITHAAGLPDLLERLGQRYRGRAQRRGLQLALEIDPTLGPDLVGPIRGLGDMLQPLMELAIDHPASDVVTLAIDVVRDEPGRQVAHFSMILKPTDDAATDSFASVIDAIRRRLDTLGGVLAIETADVYRIAIELGFIVPPAAPHVDVVALRTMLGSDAAMREVIDALREALAADVGDLEGALARADAHAVRQWLHRVSGALGMAEATGLSAMGIRLEQDLAVRPLDDMALGIRRFAMDATRALAWLREGRGHEPLI